MTTFVSANSAVQNNSRPLPKVLFFSELYLNPNQRLIAAPANAKVNHWLVKEVNSVIFVWYHADQLKPSWEPTPIKEISSGKRVFQVRSQHTFNCRIQEIHENGADVSLNCVYFLNSLFHHYFKVIKDFND